MTTHVPKIEPARSYWDLVRLRAEASPDRAMVADDRGRTMTFGEYRAAAEAVAAGLARSGIGAGTTVSWQLPTTLESVVLMAALARLGARQNPIIPILRHADLDHIVGQLRSDVLITPAVFRGFDHAAMARSVAGKHAVRTLVVDHTSTGLGDLALPVGDTDGLPAPPPADGDVRWVYYSSGTTAAPKGVQHDDASLIAGSNALVDLVGIDSDDVFPMVFPVTHIGGPAFLAAQLRVGCRLLVVDIFDPVVTPAVMAEHGVTILGSAPPFFQAYLEAQKAHGPDRLFTRLRMGMSGGAPSPPELHFEVKDKLGGIGIVQGWGLTEFPIATEAAPTDSDEVLAETNGRAGPGVEIKVVGHDGTDQEPGEEGELRVRGPQLFKGYVDTALNEDAFDEDGWLRTGDLGTVDVGGNVRITGRIKDVIIRNAENISAVEVENVLYLHPDVIDVAVVGIPDPRTGERCCAALVLAEGATPLTLTAVSEHCRSAGLAPQRMPERLDFFDELPRNAMGKLLKQEIRSRVLERAEAEPG